MTILTEKFRFIRDDVFLCPWVDTETGKQRLFMQKFNLETNAVDFEESIYCIHTAVTDISPEEFVDYRNDADAQDQLYNETLEIRSSEKLKQINLAPEEKFNALKSWVAGIAESGLNAFKLQSEIERLGNLAYPISSFLLSFMLMVDSEFIDEYISKIERECVYEGVKSESFILASLIPIFEVLWDEHNQLNLSEFDIQILKRIINNPTFRLKEEFLLTFPVYIRYKMENDKDFILNYTVRLKTKPYSDENKLIEKLIPLFAVILEDYYEIGKTDKKIISNLLSINILDKIFRDNPENLLPIINSDNNEEYLHNFINDIKRDFETGKINDEEFQNSLKNLIEFANTQRYDQGSFYPLGGKIIGTIMEIDPPLTLFKNNIDYMGFLVYWKPSFIPSFLKRIDREVTKGEVRDNELFLKLINPLLRYTFYDVEYVEGLDEPSKNEIKKTIFELNPPIDFYELYGPADTFHVNSDDYLYQLIKNNYLDNLSKQVILQNLLKNSKNRLMILVNQINDVHFENEFLNEFNRLLNLGVKEPTMEEILNETMEETQEGIERDARRNRKGRSDIEEIGSKIEKAVKESGIEELDKKIEREFEGNTEKTVKINPEQSKADRERIKKRVIGLIKIHKNLPIDKFAQALNKTLEEAENLIYELAADDGISCTMDGDVCNFPNLTTESEKIFAEIYKLIDDMDC